MLHDVPATQPRPRFGLSRFLTNLRNNADMAGVSPQKSFLGFILAWVVFFGIMLFMPQPDGLTLQGKATLAVVVWASIIWVSEAIPVGITGVAIPMLLVLSGAVDKFPNAVSGFTSNAYFICMAAFIMAAIIQLAGIDKRIAITLLHKLRIRSANSTIMGLFGVNFILSIIVPGANPRGALLLPIVNGITNLFGDTPAERAVKKHIM